MVYHKIDIHVRCPENAYCYGEVILVCPLSRKGILRCNISWAWVFVQCLSIHVMTWCRNNSFLFLIRIFIFNKFPIFLILISEGNSLFLVFLVPIILTSLSLSTTTRATVDDSRVKYHLRFFGQINFRGRLSWCRARNCIAKTKGRKLQVENIDS